MKIFATLIPTEINSAMPSLLIEELFDTNEEYNDILDKIYLLRCQESRFKVQNNKVILYNEVEEYLNIKVKDSFISCLKSSGLLLVDFHVWIIDKFFGNVISNFFITCYYNKDTKPKEEEILLSHVPFLNVSGTIWSKRNEISPNRNN